jgi:hypothetical protein
MATPSGWQMPCSIFSHTLVLWQACNGTSTSSWGKFAWQRTLSTLSTIGSIWARWKGTWLWFLGSWLACLVVFHAWNCASSRVMVSILQSSHWKWSIGLSTGNPRVWCIFGRTFYSPLLCDPNEPLVMPNGQVLAKLWSRKIQRKLLLNVAYNAFIFPTNTAGKEPRVKHMQNLVR